ncbi:hypothetical protein TIFTF001_039660 [Ficus carica]|uniref:DUF4408 domain-containing protein n=1 Tax=Ficus carica TaxID=3494 RepID=A0AA88E9Y8_FICCA|nr:hypothetical protein TIFTF001_039660 [Ficus carica]
MNKFKKSELVVLSLLTILLIIAPLLSSSLRPTYIYFLTNLLIITLGAEAGLLSSFFSKPSNFDQKFDKKTNSFAPQKLGTPSEASHDKRVLLPYGGGEAKVGPHGEFAHETKFKVVGSHANVKAEKVKKCPSVPSLFFIGGGENNEGDFDEGYYEDEEEEEEEEVGEISGQELFAKAENFIGNFYKQLQMQREESWKRIHGFYQRAF